MSLQNSMFKLGAVVTATFSSSASGVSTPVYTYNSQIVSDVSTNVDYLEIQVIGGNTTSTQQIILPANSGNYIFIKNGSIGTVNVGLSSATNITISSGENASLFCDGSQWNKVTLASPTLNFLSYSNTSTLDPTTMFLVQTSSGSTYNITWSQLETLMGVSSTAANLIANACSTYNLNLSGAQTVDGVVLSPGMTCLVLGQTSAINNGLYVVQAGHWTRSTNLANGSSAGNTTIAVKDGYEFGLYINTNLAGSDIVGINVLTYENTLGNLNGLNGIVVANSSIIGGGINILGVHYDYVINSVATLRAATVEGSTSTATTIHLYSGSYLITGYNGTSSGLIDLTELTLVVNSGITVEINGTQSLVSTTTPVTTEGFKNGGLICNQGSSVKLNNLTWVSTTTSNQIISTSTSNISINNCMFAGGLSCISQSGGELYIYNTIFGDPNYGNGSSFIYVDPTVLDVSGSTWQGELYCQGCVFGPINTFSIQVAPGAYNLKKLHINGCTFASAGANAGNIFTSSNIQYINISNNYFNNGNYCGLFMTSNMNQSFIQVIGNIFTGTAVPIYLAVGSSGNTVGSLLIEGNTTFAGNMIYSTNSSGSLINDAFVLYGYINMLNNYSQRLGAFLSNVMPMNYSGNPNSSTISNSLTLSNTTDYSSVQKHIVASGNTAGVSHEVHSVMQSASTVNPNAYIENFVNTGNFSMQVSIPYTTTQTTITLTPFQLDTTFNVYMGTVEFFLWVRTNSQTGMGVGYAKVPFICSYNGGMCLASIGSAYIPSMNDISNSGNWYWFGAGVSPNSGRMVGQGQTYDSSGQQLMFEQVSSTISNGIPTLSLVIPAPTGGVPEGTQRWLVAKFEYTAIASDATE